MIAHGKEIAERLGNHLDVHRYRNFTASYTRHFLRPISVVTSINAEFGEC